MCVLTLSTTVAAQTLPEAAEGGDLLSAGELADSCRADQEGDAAGRLCRSFIGGFVQTIFALQSTPGAEQTICLDIATTSFDSVRDTVLAYMDTTEDRGEEAAFQLAGEALQQSYSCDAATGT